jgi:hypothetical protein
VLSNQSATLKINSQNLEREIVICNPLNLLRLREIFHHSGHRGSQGTSLPSGHPSRIIEVAGSSQGHLNIGGLWKTSVARRVLRRSEFTRRSSFQSHDSTACWPVAEIKVEPGRNLVSRRRTLSLAAPAEVRIPTLFRTKRERRMGQPFCRKNDTLPKVGMRHFLPSLSV